VFKASVKLNFLLEFSLLFIFSVFWTVPLNYIEVGSADLGL